MRARPVALVTGASSGIGAALAREFAVGGHDLVLTARTRPPMERLAAELAQAGAAATVVAADLVRPGAAQALAEDIGARGLAIDAVVNNAGIGAYGRFDESDPQRIAEMLHVNVVALTELTRSLLPQMVARRRGAIMLVASTAGFQPGPLFAVYCATKAYVLSFGEALAHELAGSGVAVTVLCPGATATNFFAVAGAGRAGSDTAGMMSPEAVARIGYRALQKGRRVAVAGLRNRVLAQAGRFAPHAISLPIAKMLVARR
jgi:short-subunit dehydrogenase